MRFLVWNDLLAKHFFNPGQYGRQVRLFISKTEIISMGRIYFSGETQDKEIWSDFLEGLQKGPVGVNGADNIFEKAAQVAIKWRAGRHQRLSGYDQQFPPYLSYLVFSILPLIEIQDGYNTNNYYDRLEDFISENGLYEIASKPKRLQNLRDKLRNIDHLWDELSQWANIHMDGQLGSFQAGYTGNRGWKFVVKPLSQCIFPPVTIKKLPSFFTKAGLIPGNFYTQRAFKDLLIDKGVQWLGLRADAITLIQGDSGLGKSLTELVESEFSRWTGEQFEFTTEHGERSYLSGTVVPLWMQFKEYTPGHIDFSYRAAFASEPPTDLCLGDLVDLYQDENWSKTLAIGFQEKITLYDKRYKWKAESRTKDIRLFINAAHFNLSSRFWIETTKLSRVDDMFVLCKDKLAENIKNWAEAECGSFRDQSGLKGIPPGYTLFRFNKPRAGHPEIEMLKVEQQKSILVREGTGLKVSHNQYLNQYMPEFILINAQGEEQLVLKYQDDQTTANLISHPSLGGVWLLPESLRIGAPFCLHLAGSTEEMAKTYEIIRPHLLALKNENVPFKDAFGNPDEGTIPGYQGNAIFMEANLERVADRNPFIPGDKWIRGNTADLPADEQALLNWLITIEQTNTAGFNRAFEYIHRKRFGLEPQGLLQKRKSAVNLLDYLGYIDYDYQKDKITPLPPKLITLPASRGRKGQLIGCWTHGLLEDLIGYCKMYPDEINMEFQPASEKNQQLLIPVSISFHCGHVSTLEKIAKSVSVEFDEWYLLKLKALLPSLDDYRRMLIGGTTALSWDGVDIVQKSFNPENLVFSTEVAQNRDFTLIECRPYYLPEYGIWIKGDYYHVDKNWGKYLIFHHYSPKVHSYDPAINLAGTNRLFRNADTLALPAQLPLPRLFSRFVIQLSGTAPDFASLKLQGKSGSFNLYRNIRSSIIDNLFKFKLNIEIQNINEPL